MAKKANSVNYSGTFPWNGIGKQFDTELTAEEVLTQAELNYEVKILPHRALLPSEEFGEIAVDVPNSFLTYRTDKNWVLSTVGDVYKLIQNSESVALMDDISKSVSAKFIAGGSLGRGERIFVVAKIPGELRIVGTDDITNKYLTLSSSHDGKFSLVMGFTPIRSFNSSTLNAAIGRGLQDKVKVRHTNGKEARFAEAARILKLADTYFNDLQDTFNVLSDSPWTNDLLDNLLDEILPIAEDAKRTTRVENSRDEVKNLYANSSAVIAFPQIKNTAWAAYTAVCEYADHFKTYSERKGKSTMFENRFLAINEGAAADMKNTALSFILRKIVK